MRTTDLDEELAQPAQGTPPIRCERGSHDSHRHHGGQVMRCPSSLWHLQVHPVSCPFSMASQRLSASQPQLGTRAAVSDPRPFSLVRHTHWHPPLCCLATPCRTCACVRSGASDPRPLSTTSLCGGSASSTCSPTMLSRSVPSSQRTSSPASPHLPLSAGSALSESGSPRICKMHSQSRLVGAICSVMSCCSAMLCPVGGPFGRALHMLSPSLVPPCDTMSYSCLCSLTIAALEHCRPMIVTSPRTECHHPSNVAASQTSLPPERRSSSIPSNVATPQVSSWCTHHPHFFLYPLDTEFSLSFKGHLVLQ